MLSWPVHNWQYHSLHRVLLSGKRITQPCEAVNGSSRFTTNRWILSSWLLLVIDKRGYIPYNEDEKEVIRVFHKAVDLKFLEGTALSVTFQDGKVKRYDMRSLFSKYPQLKALEDRELFLSGKLMGAYGIVWNDELDIEAETIYEDGVTVRVETGAYHGASAKAVAAARAQAGLSQKELAERTGIDQSDISKIERGMANPSVATLERIAAAMGGELTVSIEVSA